MSLDRARTIAMTYKNLKSTTNIWCHPEGRASARVSKDDHRDCVGTKESIDHLDRMAGGFDVSRFACTVQS